MLARTLRNSPALVEVVRLASGGAALPQKARRIRKGRPLTGQRLRDAIQLTPLPILQAIVTRSAMPGEYPEVDNRIFVFNLEMGQFVMPPGDELGLTASMRG